MAVRFYDDALCNKIQKWIKDPDMKVLKPNETNRLFSMKADEKNDEPLSLPFVAISRANDIELDYPHKKPLSFDGLKLEANETYGIKLNAIPMRLQYQLDIYTRYAEEGDEYLRNFIFNLVNHPTIIIDLPYNDLWIQHRSNIRLSSQVSDSSDIPERLVGDQFTR